MRIIFSVIILMTSSIFSFSQNTNREIDSLSKVLTDKSLSRKDEAKTLKRLSTRYWSTDIEKSIELALESMKIAEELNDDTLIAFVSLSYANTLLVKGDIHASLPIFFKTLTLLKKTSHDKIVVRCYHSIGEAYRAIADYENSIKYLQEGYYLARKIQYLSEVKTILHRFSAVYYELENHKKAIAYADSSLNMLPKNNSDKFISNIYNLKGACYKQLGEYDSAITYLRKSLKIGLKINDYMDLPMVYNNMSMIFQESQDYDSAIYYAHKSLKLSKKIGLLAYQEIAYLHIFESYAALKKFDSAYVNHTHYTGIRWQIHKEENTKDLAEMKSKYELDKKEQENAKLLVKNTLQQQKIVKQRFLIALIILIIFIVMVIPILINKSRIRLRKANELLTTQNQEIEQKSKQLSEVNKTKDKILSIIAHDMKNPFQSIIGFSRLLSDDIKESNYTNIQEFASFISDGTQKLDVLLSNLLNWSQVQVGSLKVRNEKVSLSHLSEEIRNLFQTAIKEKNIDFSSNIKDDHFAFCDLNSISAVIRNLISNAIKFTPMQGIIQIRTQQTNQELEIVVTDNGVGMDKANLDALFSMDKTISAGTNNEKGSGFGLILCKELVELNGGRIVAESELGKGSTFRIYLPAYSS
ncbi:MAG: tetratricopeptide repeat-containing sensor histidine kinase [Bacteroidetes bacterium]|nr:tetratricopeptide repeat-containing sensor histidine kinase [Bacteroidota bacterium]MBT5528115.1 tetratricopeptide repeat-containing sensor histidine kinase [Cytophagia bacterium]MBT3801026.1 tetratricopeptide repeat-containing sensor histidine kinase [Bacteroidota bacterium]MBT3935479.1 tetratricopeptide repeat-containing sensor histidine kinase [Bacteroidota bacterium]MBT4339653.1 tetratricopeptide repeat-containing sensor histidine kinase [Bacteroidota bacterium]